MDLETDPEIVLRVNPDRSVKASLKLSNPIPSMTISFKVPLQPHRSKPLSLLCSKSTPARVISAATRSRR